MNRMILLEGLPGTGKTTNSYKLYEQLVRNGWDVRWLQEVSQPHPTLFFSEACLTKEEYWLFTEKYSETAEILSSIAEIRASTYEKWEALLKAALQDDMIYILDSSIFQYQIFTYLLNGADYQRLAGFVHSIMKMLRPLHPALIYLYRENTEDSIVFIEKQRGFKALESTWERDKERTYYRNKQQDVTYVNALLGASFSIKDNILTDP